MKKHLAASFIVTIAAAQLAACGGSSQPAGNPPMPEEEVHANPPGHEELEEHSNPPGPETAPEETPEETPEGPTENPPGPEL
jgi:hypothetical protein